MAVSDLENQLRVTTEIAEEKNQLLQRVREQYELSTQTWHAAEEDFNAMLKNMTAEKEELTQK